MSDPVKFIIWACPRTCSSALLKCLSGLPGAKVFFEMYSAAFLAGPDRLDPTSPALEPPVTPSTSDAHQNDQGCTFPDSNFKYEWIKEIMEGDYPDKSVVVSKEIAYCLNYRYDSIPEGYRHVFLLRHPCKVFPSWRKLIHQVLVKILELQGQIPDSFNDFAFDQTPPQIFPPGKAYKEAYDLYEYVKEKKLDEDPIIIDADDLVEDPAAIMSALCSKLQVPYSDALLTWDKGTEILDTWTLSITYKMFAKYDKGFENFRNTTCFKKQASDKQAATSVWEGNITPDIKPAIEFSMPFYLKMYQQRLKGSSTKE